MKEHHDFSFLFLYLLKRNRKTKTLYKFIIFLVIYCDQQSLMVFWQSKRFPCLCCYMLYLGEYKFQTSLKYSLLLWCTCVCFSFLASKITFRSSRRLLHPFACCLLFENVFKLVMRHSLLLLD